MKAALAFAAAFVSLLLPAAANTLASHLFVGANASANCVLRSPPPDGSAPIVSIQCTKGSPAVRVQLVTKRYSEIHIADSNGTPTALALPRPLSGPVFAMVNF